MRTAKGFDVRPGVPWRPSGDPWSPVLLRGRRGTMRTAKGSDACTAHGHTMLSVRETLLLVFDVEGCGSSVMNRCAAETEVSLSI